MIGDYLPNPGPAHLCPKCRLVSASSATPCGRCTRGVPPTAP